MRNKNKNIQLIIYIPRVRSCRQTDLLVSHQGTPVVDPPLRQTDLLLHQTHPYTRQQSRVISGPRIRV